MAESEPASASGPDVGSRLPGYVVGALFAALGLYLLVASLSFPEAVGRSDPGPAFVPRLAGAGLVLLSILHLLRVPPPASADERYPSRSAMLRVGAVFVALLAYAFGLRELGFILSTLVFLAVTLWLANVRRPLVLVAISLTVSVGLHLTFAEVLNVPLPRGLIERML